MNTARIISVLFSLAVAQTTFTQSSFNFHHLTSNDGLSDGVITAIAQDKYGYIWIASASGLNQYNGYSVKLYQNVPGDKQSYPATLTYALLCDAKGNLWLGGYNGLYRFNYNNSQFLQVPDTRNLIIRKIVEDGSDNLYLATNQGLARFIPSTQKLFFFKENDKIQNRQLLGSSVGDFIIHEQKVYLTTDTGLVIFDRAAGRSTLAQLSPLKGESVNKVALDGNGNLWITYGFIGGSLLKTDLKLKKIQVFHNFEYSPANVRNSTITRLFTDSKKRLWVTSTSYGVALYDDKNDRFRFYNYDPLRPTGVTTNHFTFIFQDRQGFIWLGSEGYGVDYFHPDKNFIQILAPLSAEETAIGSFWARAITEDKQGNLWMGWGGALTMRAPTDSSLKMWRNLKDRPPQVHYNSIRSLLCDEEGNIWIGTANGVNRYHPSTGKMDFLDEKDSLPLSFYWSIIQDSRKNIWFASRNGLFYRDSTKKNHSIAGHPVLGQYKNLGVRHIMEDSRHRLWIALTLDGLIMYDPEKNISRRWKRTETNDTTLIGNSISSIAEDKNGVMWISSYMGMVSYDPDKDKFTQYTREKGLISQKTSNLIVDDKNRLWIGSSSGLLMLDSSRQHFKHFDLRDGLPTMEFNDQGAYKLRDGRFVFSTLKGFIAIDPMAYEENVASPQVYLSSFKVNNHELAYSSSYEEMKQLDLKHDQNFFSIELAALNYSNPPQTWYAYKLEPFDQNWVYTRQRVANYTNVPGGNYVFRYKATTDPNNWNIPEKTLRVHLNTVFYQTSWFGILVIFFIGALGYWFFRKRIEHREKIYSLQAKAQALEKEKTIVMYESLKQQLNPHFLFNSLTSLRSLIRVDQKLAGDFLDSMSRIYRYILKSRDHEIVPLIDEIKFARTYIKLQQARFEAGLQVNIKVEEQYYDLKIVPVTLQNLIENAIKHNSIDDESPLVIDLYVEDQYLHVRNNLQKKNFVETSNKQGLANLRTLYHYLSNRELQIKEDREFFTVKIPLI